MGKVNESLATLPAQFFVFPKALFAPSVIAAYAMPHHHSFGSMGTNFTVMGVPISTAY